MKIGWWTNDCIQFITEISHLSKGLIDHTSLFSFTVQLSNHSHCCCYIATRINLLKTQVSTRRHVLFMMTSLTFFLYLSGDRKRSHDCYKCDFYLPSRYPTITISTWRSCTSKTFNSYWRKWLFMILKRPLQNN